MEGMSAESYALPGGWVLRSHDREKPSFLARECYDAWSLRTANRIPAAISAPLSLAAKFRFPETETAAGRGSEEGQASGAVETIRRASQRERNSHAMRELPLDGCLDEVRREEGKRDRHVYFSGAALLSSGDAFRRCCRIGDDFI
jgi:hypothetical protein